MSETEAPATDAPATVPGRGKRYRLWKDGDYCIYQIAAPDSGMPAGTLLQIPDVPHFEGCKEATKFVENSGDLFAGKQLFIMRGYEVLKVEVLNTPKVSITKKPKIQVTGPTGESEDSGG
jgi:hypothetical protein